MIFNPGVYPNVPMEFYHGKNFTPIPSLSRSTIHSLIYRTPRHTWWDNASLNPDFEENKDAKFDKGKAGHSIFLEGIDCCEVIDPAKYPAKNGNIPDGWTNKDIRAARDVAKDAGKIPMLLNDWHSIKGMVEAAQRQLAVSELAITDFRAEGDSELTYVWQEEGLWCRARLDWISKDRKIILDPKFTGNSAAPGAFDRLIEPMGYDIQYAWYMRAVEKVEGIIPKGFVFWVVETDPPYLACPISLTPQYVAMGQEKVEMGLTLWKKFLESNDWPGYGSHICYLEPKPWAVTSWDEKRFSLQLANKEEDL